MGKYGQRHILESARRTVPEFQHAAVIKHFRRRLALRIEFSHAIGTRHTAAQLFFGVVREELLQDSHRTLLIRKGNQSLDECRIHIRKFLWNEETTIGRQPLNDCLGRGKPLPAAARTDILQKNRLSFIMIGNMVE